MVMESQLSTVRAIVSKSGDEVKVTSEEGEDITADFSEIVEELQSWSHDFVFDCEVLVDMLKVLDILYVDGEDLRDMSSKEKQKYLANLFSKTKARILINKLLELFLPSPKKIVILDDDTINNYNEIVRPSVIRSRREVILKVGE